MSMDNPLNFEVTDRKSFIKFVELLRNDLLNDKWENNNLSDYLEAISSYSEDIQGFYDNTGQKVNADIPSWKVFADILIGASMYE